MKFHLQTQDAHLVTGLGDGWIRVGAVEGFAAGGFDALTEADFAALLAQQPEIVLLGTGRTQRFPHPRLSAALAAAHVGLEVMDTRAACRTYNILLGEGRRVVAAVIL